MNEKKEERRHGVWCGAAGDTKTEVQIDYAWRITIDSPLKRKAKRERMLADVYSSGVRRLHSNVIFPFSRKHGERSVTATATAVGMPIAKTIAPTLAKVRNAKCSPS